ncbi:intercellular adhesion molecule 3 [Lates calcarifer]|uniref:Intercellular adhesion molecule 3 n=1 Tax=Lates calcarifer TaxID=8187 RepID=A0AAJ7PT64_LATCA|nr:intercellular adhesion molecule 3 [Lates calcarifer]
MFASGWSITLLLLRLFGSVTSFPVSIYTPAPFLPLQILPPSSFPSNLPSDPSSLIPSSISSSEERAHCPLKISPSTVVVRFEDPVTVNCSVPPTGLLALGWEVPNSMETPLFTMGRFLVWSVDRMTEWNIKPKCYALVEQGGQCHIELLVIVYKPPDNVSISFRNHSGPLLEGHQYTLQCEVHNVAPVENLTVTFYRGKTALGQLQSNNTEKTPMTEIFTVDIIPSKEDNGVQYWCEAKLELGPEGPEHPPVVTSQKLKAAVLFGPHLICPTKLQVKEGESLSCEVRGNPQPSVTWLRDGQVVVLPSHSSRKHAGKYTVWTKGHLGQKNFTVEVEILSGSGTANSCNRYFLLAILFIQINWL